PRRFATALVFDLPGASFSSGRASFRSRSADSFQRSALPSLPTSRSQKRATPSEKNTTKRLLSSRNSPFTAHPFLRLSLPTFPGNLIGGKLLVVGSLFLDCRSQRNASPVSLMRANHRSSFEYERNRSGF